MPPLLDFQSNLYRLHFIRKVILGYGLNPILILQFSILDARPIHEIRSPLTSLIEKDLSQKQQQEDDDKTDSKKSKEKSWRNMKYTLIIFGVTIGISGLYLIFELGKPRYDSGGVEILDQYSGMPIIKQYIWRTLGELDYYGQVCH